MKKVTKKKTTTTTRTATFAVSTTARPVHIHTCISTDVKRELARVAKATNLPQAVIINALLTEALAGN